MATKAKKSKAGAKGAAKSRAKGGAKRAAKAGATGSVRTARSVRRADLTKLTQAAVKAATEGKRVKFVTEPIWGYVLDIDVGGIETAQAVTRRLSEGARGAGINLTAEPCVLLRKGITIAGFIERDLNVPVRF